MSHSLFLALLVFGFVWATFSIYYQSAIRPLAADWALFRLKESRIKLEDLASAGTIAADSFPYSFACRVLDGQLNSIQWIGVGTVIEFLLFGNCPEAREAAARFDRESPRDIKSILSDNSPAVTSAIIANSPWYAGFAILIVMCVATRNSAVQAMRGLFFSQSFGHSYRHAA
jgi:hypothetical protein